MPKDSKNPLTFLRVTKSNIDDLTVGLSDLHYAVRGQKNDPGYWKWCYLQNPAGKSNAIVAVRAGRVVGKLGIVCMQLIVQSERVMAGLMEGLSVESSERTWHCLRGILEMSLAESQKEKMAFGFGISTPSAAKLNRRLGCDSLGRAPLYLGFLNVAHILKGRSVPYPISLIGWLSQPIVGLRDRSTGPSDIEIRSVENFDHSFDELWNNIEKTRTVAVVKGSAYLNWRYAKCPNRRYTCLAAYRMESLEGLVVYRSVAARHDAFVLELLARNDNPETMKVLLLRTFLDLKTQGSGLVAASFPTHSPAATVLKELGFKSWATRLWNIDMIISTDHRRGSCPESDAKSWDFSLGDWLYY